MFLEHYPQAERLAFADITGLSGDRVQNPLLQCLGDSMRQRSSDIQVVLEKILRIPEGVPTIVKITMLKLRRRQGSFVLESPDKSDPLIEIRDEQ